MGGGSCDLVLERLIEFLEEEAQLLREFHTEVADIKLELEFIASFLRDADARAATEESNEGVKTWVKHVREAAYGIEDVIDEYMLCAAKHNDQHGFKSFLKKIAGRIRSLKKEREMMSKIQDLKRSIHEIGEKRRRLDIHVSDHGGSSRGHVDPRAGLHFVDNDALVGIEASRDELTTLAKKIYDDVKERFDCHAWITVSQSNIMAELPRTMIRQFHEAKNDLPPIGINYVTDVEELISKSREYLQYKRKCDGLPLAVVSIGGLLSTKGKDVFEWTRLRDDLKGLVKENQEMTLEETANAYLTRLITEAYFKLNGATPLEKLNHVEPMI
ncbi:hypothetical protein F3Y22_tig00014213pilonHSYRG00090 [Hibiscus syriacus]|uniref:Uncharacterized protein n=1 Tax=Hibiscus syriacus TaxID=106335 RepID=A0A6A3C1V6_HIBSY|nr:hypothetical protein F3Y22_tig00014213pilonHSYRG00090 [Hibiscus syriacus]